MLAFKDLLLDALTEEKHVSVQSFEIGFGGTSGNTISPTEPDARYGEALLKLSTEELLCLCNRIISKCDLSRSLLKHISCSARVPHCSICLFDNFLANSVSSLFSFSPISLVLFFASFSFNFY